MERGFAESEAHLLPFGLTEGGIRELIQSEGHFSGRHAKQPKLQIVNIRRVPANALTDVYWVSFLHLLGMTTYAVVCPNS